MANLPPSYRFALVTPSYAPDFERCQLLVESSEHCLLGDTKHYIVVDRRDQRLFSQLTSDKVRLLVVEDLLPSWIFRVAGIQKWWMSLRTLPIRNWILQQLVKMSIFEGIDEDVVVFCDSDNTFVRPFDLQSLLIQDKSLPLLRVPFVNDDIQTWIASAKDLLGIPHQAVEPVTYVSNMITWERGNVFRMRERIEEVHGTHWIRAVCSHRSISEYMIYGIFVEYVLGLEAARHHPFDTELIKPSWSTHLDDKGEVNRFFEDLSESNIGVMIHSKDEVPVSIYRDKVRSLWKVAS